jgi:hypothetical protein
MASTFTIPLTTLQPGTRTFGPASLADADTLVVLTIDRTVTGGFNSLTPATATRISIEQSNDGGATWLELASATFTGGAQTMHGGLPVNSNDVGVFLRPGTGRRGQAVVVITGTAVAVQGSLAIT